MVSQKINNVSVGQNLNSTPKTSHGTNNSTFGSMIGHLCIGCTGGVSTMPLSYLIRVVIHVMIGYTH